MTELKEQPKQADQNAEPRRKKVYVKPMTSVIHAESCLMAPIASTPIDPSDTEAKGNPFNVDEDKDSNVWSGVEDFNSQLWE